MRPLSRSRAVATGLTLGTAAAGLLLAPTAAMAATTSSASTASSLSAPTVTPGTVAAGAAVTVSGTGCFLPAGEDPDYFGAAVLLTHGEWTQTSLPLAVEDTDVAANGTWSLKLTVPTTVAAGTYQVRSACAWYNDAEEYPAVNLTVTAAGGTATQSPSAPSSTTPTSSTDVVGARANTPGVASTTTSSTTGDTTAPGKKVVKVYRGFKPHEVVTVVLHSTPRTIGTFTADAQGVLTVEFVLPSDVPTGDHELILQGNMGTYFQEAIVVAAAVTTSSSSSELAWTGASIGLPLALGGGLVLAGAGALMVSRRRSAGATQA